MSITLNSQIHGPTTTDNACGYSMICNQIQGEHTLILRTDMGVFKTTLTPTVPNIHKNIKTSRITFANFNNNSRFYKLSYDVNRKKFCLL
jgi:hypothetical protein